MQEWIWGHKSLALFDVWSIEHVLAGLSIGAAVIKATGHVAGRHAFQENVALRRHFDVLLVLLLSFFWEMVEHYLESGLLGRAVMEWFAGVEMWGNRIITDPLMVLLGYLLVRKRPALVWPARFFSVLWVVVHVFVFPHSMYLHEIMEGSGREFLVVVPMVVLIGTTMALVEFLRPSTERSEPFLRTTAATARKVDHAAGS